jgi:transposase
MWTAESRALVGDFGAGQALSDEQYALLAPLIPPARPGGRPRTTDMRRLLDGLFYLVRTGCQWRHLPPPGLPALADGVRVSTCAPSRAPASGRRSATTS